MVNENSFIPSPDQNDKYRNEDYVRKMFEQRNTEEIEKIKKLHNLTDKQVELFCGFAQLRKNTLEKMKDEIEGRKKTNPAPTQKELSLGAYIEQIEPHVRKTVLKLMEKGYTSYESGFGNFDSQRISFSGEPLSGINFSESLKEELAREGAELILKPNSIEIKFTDFKDLDILENLWKKVEEVLPDLNKAPEPNNTLAAVRFRKKFEK